MIFTIAAHERRAPQGPALPLRRVRLRGRHQGARPEARLHRAQEGEALRLRDLQLQIRAEGESLQTSVQCDEGVQNNEPFYLWRSHKVYIW